MTHHLEFEYTYEEFSEAQRAHLKGVLRPGRKTRRIRGWVMFLGLATFFFIVLHSKKRPKPAPPPDPDPAAQTSNSLSSLFLPLLPWLGIMAGIVIVLFVFWKYAVKRSWGSQRFLRDGQTMDLSDAGLRHVSKLMTTDYVWSAFVRWIETPNLFVLYSGDISVEIIPKRAFSAPADVEGFREFLSKTIGPVGAKA